MACHLSIYNTRPVDMNIWQVQCHGAAHRGVYIEAHPGLTPLQDGVAEPARAPITLKNLESQTFSEKTAKMRVRFVHKTVKFETHAETLPALGIKRGQYSRLGGSYVIIFWITEDSWLVPGESIVQRLEKCI